MTLYFYRMHSSQLTSLTQDIQKRSDLSILNHYYNNSPKADVLILGNSQDSIKQALLKGLYSIKKTENRKPKDIGFLFTGQGCQYSGMIEPWLEIPTFKQAINSLLSTPGGTTLKELLSTNTNELIHKTEYTQPALFAFEWAMSQLWKDLGLEANIVLGHSVGEYPAYAYAGGFKPEDGFSLINVRAQLMGSLPPGGGMLAIKSCLETVNSWIKYLKNISIAAINSENQIVVSGDLGEVERLIEQLEQNSVSYQKLSVSHAFHSNKLDPILAALDDAASKITHLPLKIKTLSNLSGGLHHWPTSKDYWSRHARESVQFTSCLQHLQSADALIELGPQPILSSIIKRSVSTPCYTSCSRARGPDALINTIYKLHTTGFEFNWLKQKSFTPLAINLEKTHGNTSHSG
jgi:acyl transferase domain-containing protein